MPKPADFFLGLTEFFTILLPGFIFIIGLQSLGMQMPVRFELQGSGWITTLIASYLIGRLLFDAGSAMENLFKGRETKYVNKKHQTLIKAIEKYHSNFLAGSTYKWSRFLLQKRCPIAWAEVQRVEVDSKLFRSLVAPMLIFSAIYVKLAEYSSALIAALTAIVSVLLYLNLRYKAIKRAFEFALFIIETEPVDSSLN
jgi:hypothetical protein